MIFGGEVTDKATLVFFTQAGWGLSTALDKNPVYGLAHMQTVMMGHAITTIVPLELVHGAERSLESLSEYLEDASIEDIQACPHFSLPPGSSVWVPFGHVALTVGVPTEEENYVTLQNEYVLSVEHAENFSNRTKADVKAYITRALARSSPVWGGGNRDKANAYVEAITVNLD